MPRQKLGDEDDLHPARKLPFGESTTSTKDQADVGTTPSPEIEGHSSLAEADHDLPPQIFNAHQVEFYEGTGAKQIMDTLKVRPLLSFVVYFSSSRKYPYAMA
jgi:hypothetical protein